MENRSMMMDILTLHQRKYNAVSEILRLTEEMGQLLSNNDNVSVQLVLQMRQDEMNRADDCSQSIARLEDSMTSDDRRQIQRILEDTENTDICQTFEEKKLQEILRNIKLALKRTVELDSRISSRIAGKDSFYSTGK